MISRRMLYLAASLGTLLATAGASPPARADQSLYTDSLQNGWTNYSWATVNLAATSPVHGGADAISVQSGAYQALYLHHDAQNSAAYTALTFWINGGPTGGQRLQVQATLGGNSQPAYALPAPQANTWTQVTIPLSALGAAGQSNFDGVWIQDASGQSSVPVYFVDDVALTSTPQTAPGTTIKVDAGAGRHPISPLVYGVAYGDAKALADLNAPLNRQGGNNTTRYNWQLNADNKANDYFFESIGDASATPGERGDTFIAGSRSGGAQAMLTLPTLGWVAKLGPNRQKLSSFSVAKYGPQQRTDPYMPDAGSGVRGDGTNVTGNDPGDASLPANADFQAGWISHLVSQWGTAAQGGLRYYLLDNEPSLWFNTHRDVHPVGPTMDEIKSDILAYGAKVKAADPSASVVAPEEWGWSGYFSSGYDQQYGAAHNYQGHPDRDAHGGMDYLPWLLDQVHKSDLATGKRSLDVFSVHFYPQGGEFSDAVDTATAGRRNRSTRQLWDPNYVSESWINDKVMLIPRLKGWVNAYYPGTKTAITEYNWGAEGSMNGATTQADIFGIFGREGLDLATRWTTPAAGTPTYLAMKLYRNYDGAKSGFGDVSVSDAAPDPDSVSSFAAVRSSDGALTVTVINKSASASAPVTVSLANFTPGASAQAWQLTSSASAITRLTDVAVTGGALAVTVPAQSVTLFVVPAAPSVPPPAAPTGLTAQGGNAQAALTWSGSTGAANYTLYRGTAGGAKTLLQSGLTAANFTDTGLTNGMTYFYQVAAVNSVGTSAKSAEASAKPSAKPAALVNGSFEAPSLRAGGYQYNPTRAGWAFAGNSGIQSNGSAWGAANAPDGTQTAFLQGYNGGAAGSLSQSVNAAASTYTLTFQAARRYGQVQPLRFSVDGVQVGSLLTAASSSFASMTTGAFTLSAGMHTLTLAATDNSGDNSALVDRVSLVQQ